MKPKFIITGVCLVVAASLLLCFLFFGKTSKDNTKEITTEEEKVTTELTTTEKKNITTTELTTEELTTTATEEETTTETVYLEKNTYYEVEETEATTKEEVCATDTDAIDDYDYSYTETDIPWVVYEVVECEVHGGDKESKMHVAHVIRNRVWSDLFPNDYYSVCTASYQFCMRSDVEQSTIDAVNKAMAIEDTTYGALFFHSMDWMAEWCGYSWKFTDNVGHHFY